MVKKLVDFLVEQSIPFEQNVSGASMTSFRIGGEIKLVAKPQNPSQIKDLYAFLIDNEIKNVLLGRGTNILISDEGFDGVVVLLSELNELKVENGFIFAGAGVPMLTLAITAWKNSLTGLEFAHGIPGSVGGGVYMNAGAYGGEMRQVMISCECFDKDSGEFVHLENFDCGFAYRHSTFHEKKNLIILSATFKLSEGDPEEIRAKMDVLRASRVEKQPLDYPNAGSTFKRPEGYFPGKLIEDAGLKGYSIGKAQVSEKHAGFIVNRGGACANDVKELIEYIQQNVKKKFGVTLECEIEFVE